MVTAAGSQPFTYYWRFVGTNIYYGGGSYLSDEAKWLVAALGAMVAEADALLEELYARHFGDWQEGRSVDTDRVSAQVAMPIEEDVKDSVT